jgi:hypothetical protein
MAFRLVAQQLRTHAVRGLYTAAIPPTSTPRALFGALPLGSIPFSVLSRTGISRVECACEF